MPSTIMYNLADPRPNTRDLRLGSSIAAGPAALPVCVHLQINLVYLSSTLDKDDAREKEQT